MWNLMIEKSHFKIIFHVNRDFIIFYVIEWQLL